MRMMSLRAVPKLDYATTEAINTLATNVIFSGAEYKTIMLTSCSANEGKSFVTFHLAEKLASLGYSVMLVDADLRKSVFVSRYDAVTQGPLLGMTHYLAGRCDLEDIQYRTNIENLSVIPSGKEVINSLPLLNSAGFAGMMKELRQRYHFVLVDAPPVGVIIDAAMIANICDGTLFVVTNEMVSKRELVSAVQQIQKSGCTVLGVILNKVEMDTHKSKNITISPIILIINPLITCLLRNRRRKRRFLRPARPAGCSRKSRKLPWRGLCRHGNLRMSISRECTDSIPMRERCERIDRYSYARRLRRGRRPPNAGGIRRAAGSRLPERDSAAHRHQPRLSVHACLSPGALFPASAGDQF